MKGGFEWLVSDVIIQFFYYKINNFIQQWYSKDIYSYNMFISNTYCSIEHW